MSTNKAIRWIKREEKIEVSHMQYGIYIPYTDNLLLVKVETVNKSWWRRLWEGN